MKVYGLFLAGIGVFFGIIGLIYWFTSYEDGGFLMLIGLRELFAKSKSPPPRVDKNEK